MGDPTTLHPFRIGDVVSLNGETFPMTVVGLSQQEITCVWLTSNGFLEDGTFPPKALYRIRENEANRQ